MKFHLSLLFVLALLGGCSKLAFPPPPEVSVDRDAAWPAQTAGTRPPVLTGFDSLTKEQLDAGAVMLFDGVSTYGWVVVDGDGELAAKRWEDSPALVFERKIGKDFTVTHRFAQSPQFSAGKDLPYAAKTERDEAFFGDLDYRSVTKNHSCEYPRNLFGLCTVLIACPPAMTPLGEADWKPVAGESKALWTDGVLELTGGRGMLESVREYDDFILQLEYFTEAGINSGVFFRCMPGSMMDGYECQIFNAPPEEDYKKFIGTDTGGIFRLCVGRNIGPQDGQWNYLTIAVRGPLISSWVNGVQTVDWADTRKENENPRKGLRTKPGTIQLQGHDPGTKIQFRNIRIAEL